MQWISGTGRHLIAINYCYIIFLYGGVVSKIYNINYNLSISKKNLQHFSEGYQID